MNSYAERTRPVLGFVDIGIALRCYAAAKTLSTESWELQIRVFRANRRLVAGVSHRIKFTAVHVHVSAQAGTRRRWSSNPCSRRTAGSSYVPRLHLAPEGANQRSETYFRGPSVRNQVVYIAGKPT